MRIRMLRDMPGHVGGLPAGKSFSAGRDYDVADHVGRTFVREGWAKDSTRAAEAVPAPTYVPAKLARSRAR